MTKKKTTERDKTLEKNILQWFSQNPTKLVNYKQVASGIERPGDTTVEKALSHLAEEGKVGQIDRGKFHFIHQLNEIEGKVEITHGGNAWLVGHDEEEDVFIENAHLNRALDGDIVIVKLYAKRKGKKLEGEVSEILKRTQTDFVGTLQVEKNFAFLVPDSRKMYVDIFIPAEKLSGASNGQKVIAGIDSWKENARNPVGSVKKILGLPGENNAEMHAIVAEFGFQVDFPAEVLKEVESLNSKVTKAELSKRRDFRKILTFTIDPVDAKDFDDAISFRELREGRYEIGVHIADVSHFVKEGGALDKDAEIRGTSVYLVDRTIPMLPERLSNELCSLRPNEDKFTFSAVFEMDDDGKVHSQWMGKTLIHSQKRLTYEEAQEMLEGAEGELAPVLKKLNEIAQKLRDARFKNGAISFETEEVKFHLDEEGKPTGVYTKVRKDAHKLIEEYMLLANRKVAEFVWKLAPKPPRNPFVYRIHDEPLPEKLSDFGQFLKRFGYQFEVKDETHLPSAFNKLLEKVEGRPEQNIVQSMAIRTMAKALYTSQKSGHYGLAFDYYTHFTSPIRRYPDLMVHRFLQHYLSGNPAKHDEALEARCRHASMMEQKAADAERASIKYKQAEYLQEFIGNTFTGVISGVTEWGIYVELKENKCEGMIRLSSMNDDFYEFDDKNMVVTGKRLKRKYRLGDVVRVRVKKANPQKRTIDFVMA